MTEWERFRAIMGYRPFDRLPVWYFGVWRETLDRWKAEGLSGADGIPAATEMDPDWETGMWDAQGIVNLRAEHTPPRQILEERADYRLVRTPFGAVHRERIDGSSIPQHVEEALKPTRESWDRFKRFFDPGDPARHIPDWQARAAALTARSRVNVFYGGSLFGAAREWMGIEAISFLSYDDPALYEEIIAHQANFYMELYRPVLKQVRVDFVYFFEDCCSRSGPLFSPETYRRFYHKYYARMIEFYRDCGVPHVLIDSDGWTDLLIPCWMASGFDVLFPVEVGAWKTDPVALRKKYGKDLRMLGGVNKHVIKLGEAAIRRELDPLVPLAREGGFIPIPDHRIPPDVSLDQFRTYVRVFKDVFGGAS